MAERNSIFRYDRGPVNDSSLQNFDRKFNSPTAATGQMSFNGVREDLTIGHRLCFIFRGAPR